MQTQAMQPEVRTLVDISESRAAMGGRADTLLEQARWAAEAFTHYDHETTMAIVNAVAEQAHQQAGEFAERAVEETGFGVVAHKKIKNELTAHPLVDYYRDQDFVNLRIDAACKIVEIPRPAGVVLALTPSTNPIATINYKILLAMMTRNAIVISPHPAAKTCCVDAARALAAAATAAGAPDNIIQVIEDPSIALVEELMQSPKTGVILATGGSAMVRSAYSSSSPAIGVGPGNAPVFVDRSADLNQAARMIVESKSFDNSALCTNESVLITLSECDAQLRQALNQSKAYLCNEDDVQRLRKYLFHSRGFNIECLGRDATWIAQECGIRVPQNTLILVAPIEQIGVEEPLVREKLCPVLAYHVCKSRRQAIAQARAILRLTGAGHSAAIHCRDEQTAIDYASAVEVYRVIVNAPNSQGASGFQTALAPTFTVGTGFFGRSSVGENIGPQHLVHWTRMAYNSDDAQEFGDYAGLTGKFSGALPRAPSDGVQGATSYPIFPSQSNQEAESGISRDELRRMISEELKAALRAK